MEHRVLNPAACEPEISVIIPAHDAAPSIARTLDCVAAQEGVSPEIIVVDDASTDDTPGAVEAWGTAHPAVPLQVLGMESQVYALRARLAGLELARARDVIFMDADDTWAGTHRLARVLAKKRLLNCEIVHFRTIGFKNGKCEGEPVWTAPPPFPTLAGREIFAAYARLDYISLQVWNKVYSRSLLEMAARFVGNSKIYCFEDKFFVSFILMCAQTWASSDEYIYQYNQQPAYPEKKNAGRSHDLLVLRKKVEEAFPLLGIDPEAQRDYLGFISRRLTYHLGRLSRVVENKLARGTTPQAVLAEITPWFPLEDALPALVVGMQKNMQRLRKITRRLHEA